MRRGAVIAAGAMLAVSSAVLQGAMAQVTVNPGALELLPRTPQRPAQPRPDQTRPDQTRPAPARPAARPAPRATPGAPPAASPPKPAKPPTVPVTPPAILALPPPIQVPLARPPPTPVVPTAEDAPGTATPITGGVRVTFGTERSDLNAATETAIRELARSVRDLEQTSVNIYAYAAGSTEDPSTPRRLSLARALAARAVLINEGIASTRIYPRALGAQGGDTDRDRVDVVAGTPSPPAAAAAAPPGAPPQAPAR